MSQKLKDGFSPIPNDGCVAISGLRSFMLPGLQPIMSQHIFISSIARPHLGRDF